MDKRLRIAGIVGAIAFSIMVLTSPNDPIPLPEPPSAKSENNFVEILAENLENPRSIAVVDEKIFVTEKDGRIRIIYNNELLDEPLATYVLQMFLTGDYLELQLIQILKIITFFMFF